MSIITKQKYLPKYLAVIFITKNNNMDSKRHKLHKPLKKINFDLKRIYPETEAKVIRLHFGPYKCNGVVKHRPQKIRGLIDSLKQNGFKVELIPSPHLNRFEVEILGYDVYRANIKNFEFNIDREFDTACMQAYEKIVAASNRLYRNRNIAKDMHLIERKRIFSEMSVMTI